MTPCIIHTGYIGPSEYGQRTLNGKRMGAHRVAYIEAHGEILEGLWVLHRCHVPACVNPDHLYAGTPQRNNLDTVEAGHYVSANSAKDSCPRGHEYDMVTSQGKRGCKTCQRIHVRDAMRRRRAG